MLVALFDTATATTLLERLCWNVSLWPMCHEPQICSGHTGDFLGTHQSSQRVQGGPPLHTPHCQICAAGQTLSPTESGRQKERGAF